MNSTGAEFQDFLSRAFFEDLKGNVDPSSHWVFSEFTQAEAFIQAKAPGIASGMNYLNAIFNFLPGPEVQVTTKVADGQAIEVGQTLAIIQGTARQLLTAERTALNLLQRMCGIASLTHHMVASIAHTNCVLLDTRKTSPLLRAFEKEAVLHGGGANHRFGLYDMVMLKDNHIDFAGGIPQAMQAVREGMKISGKTLPVEIETRNLKQVEQALQEEGLTRIMFDNFAPDQVREAVAMVGGALETEASGGIHAGNLVAYAETGVQFISMGMLTHSVPALDLSMKSSIHT